MIPAPWASGQFEANAPFDKLVDGGTAYTVEAIRTIPEMQGTDGLDIYTKVLAPAGIPKDDTTVFLEQLIADKAVVIALTSSNASPVYVPSTYLASFPAVDGVIYEHLCLMVDLGAVPPGMIDRLSEALDQIRQYIASKIGIDATVQFGVIPTKSYVSKQQAENFETSRQLKIANSTNIVIENERLTQENIELKAYIAKLEDALKKA